MRRTLLAAALLLSAAAAQAQTQNTATIIFTRPVYPDGSAVPASVSLSYNLYQAVQGQTKAKVGTITTTTGNITTGLLSGNVYCWEVTAFVTGQEAATESGRSNEACKPFNTPGKVTITVQ